MLIVSSVSLKRSLYYGSLAALMSGIGLPQASQAQEVTSAPTASKSSTDAPTANTNAAGSVIYSRDVSYGSAVDYRTPGREHSVETGPSALILSSLAAGLDPISDTESSGIIARSSREVGLIGSQVSLGVGGFADMSGADSSTQSIGSVQGSVVNGAVGQATGAIHNALGNVRGVLGGGQ
ncbi:hypothetical protein GCM10023115_23930 [Pontixanthobacter gangjinensis]|uniref:Uncharacterized protein n=1 Tax=Pontixanthobacter gangjinensis TaxID=1028742 RepID=A0A6I4SRT6_9SPHN|nr:hypothetical protein [Pontixanthobacter gangjinensis]MXO57637.1 hypothetical protein [Pontixanthobacter gangjinensis]